MVAVWVANRRTGTRVESVAGKLLICLKLWRTGVRNAWVSRLLTREETGFLSGRLAEDRIRTCQVEMAAVAGEVTHCTNYCGMWSHRTVMPSSSLEFLASGYRPDFDGEQLRMTARSFGRYSRNAVVCLIADATIRIYRKNYKLLFPKQKYY